MPEIHQILTAAATGDAITGSALALRDVLRRVGPSDVYAEHVEPALDGEVIRLRRYSRRPSAASGRNVLVYHASIGDRDVLSFLLQRPEDLVLQYHNVTPAAFAAPWDERFTRLLDEGRLQLRALRDRVVAAAADSRFNAQELEELGYTDVAVAPPVIDIDRLRHVVPDPGTMRHFEEAATGPVVLYVGQLLPHKRPDMVVQLAHVLSTYHDPDVQVVLAGAGRLTSYADALGEYVRQLNLPNVWLTGSVPDAQLAAFYRSADVFVTMSEHEGFCIPLLEAMTFDVPIVARRHAAIPETLGRAGLLLPAGAGAELVAEAVVDVLGEPARRAALVEGGRRRRADYRPELAQSAFLASLARVI